MDLAEGLNSCSPKQVLSTTWQFYCVSLINPFPVLTNHLKILYSHQISDMPPTSSVPPVFPCLLLHKRNWSQWIGSLRRVLTKGQHHPSPLRPGTAHFQWDPGLEKPGLTWLGTSWRATWASELPMESAKVFTETALYGASFSLCPVLFPLLPQVLITRAPSNTHPTCSSPSDCFPGVTWPTRACPLLQEPSLHCPPPPTSPLHSAFGVFWGLWIWNACSLHKALLSLPSYLMLIHLLELTSHITFSWGKQVSFLCHNFSWGHISLLHSA